MNIFIVVLLATLFGSHVDCTNDTSFDGRFEYEYKVIQKLVQLENNDRTLSDTVLEIRRTLEGYHCNIL